MKNCKYCGKETKNKKFCTRKCYHLWMIGKTYEDIMNDKEKIKNRKQKLEEKVYGIRRNHSYEEYYGEDKAAKVKNKNSLTKLGKPLNSPVYAFRKGKTYEEIYGKEKAQKIKNKESKSRLGVHPWNFNLTKEINNSLQTTSNLMKRNPLTRWYNFKGRFTSKVCDNVFYQSEGELEFLKIFSNLDIIKKIERCNFWLPYIDDKHNKKRYTPDFNVLFNNNDRAIIEAKPNGMYNKNVILKSMALDDYCLENNYKWIMFPSPYDKYYNEYTWLLTNDLKETHFGYEVFIPVK